MCIFYCDECDELICSACLPESHSNHKFQEIEEAFDKKLTAIKSIQEETKKELEEIKNDSQKLEEFVLCSSKNFEMDKLKIQNQNSILKMRIEQKNVELLEELDDRRNKMEERISKEREAVQARKNYLLLKTKKINRALKSFQPSNIFHILKVVNEVEIPYNSSNLKKVFRFKSKDTGIIANGFGSFEEEDVSKACEHVEINFEVLQREIPLPGTISGIINCKNESHKLWVYNNKNILRKILYTEVNLEMENEIFVKVQDISVDKEGVLYLIEKGSSDIKRLTKRKGFKRFANMSPFQPISIHVTEKQEIIVGLINDGKCKVVFLEQSGKVKIGLFLDQHSNPLFHHPNKITSAKNGDIWVADCKPGLEGRVVILNKDGKFKSIISKDDVKDKFEPNGLVSTDTGHVIVSSKLRFFIFSQNGLCLDIKFISVYKHSNDFDRLMISMTIPPVISIEKTEEVYLLSSYIGVEKNVLMFCFMGLDEDGQESPLMKTARINIID
ncbi:unnamed protein product [Mytilus coruscus]|uniref:B box-type domain-containing protein n=1 Tax=Mytilus coruscus TaxID=42192 RepID=A0A6J8BS01_MYTCO|nr:unnamed protein product [Mytilus coruscus]